MAVTAIAAWGRLEMQYTTYGKPHKLHVYVPEFGVDPEVGTFVSPTTPVSLDILAKDLANKINTLSADDSALEFGSWLGEQHTPGTANGFVTIVNGTITTPTSTPGTFSNPTGSPCQETWSFRATGGTRMRLELFGLAYTGFMPILYGGINATFKAVADYITGSSVILSRNGSSIASLISITSDTNDGLQRRYRR